MTPQRLARIKRVLKSFRHDVDTLDFNIMEETRSPRTDNDLVPKLIDASRAIDKALDLLEAALS